MIKPGKRQAKFYLPASLFGLALSFCGFSTAQEIDLQSRIDETSSALQNLDDKASACIAASDSSTEGKLVCDDFLAAVDGELMANYVLGCSALRAWRDDFVTQATNSDNDIENSTEMLELMVAIEFNCARDALQSRTQYVVSAFTLLQSRKSPRFNAELSRRLAELKFEATESRGRQSLQNSVLQQQSRRQQETQRQSDSLEIELIRQRIRNSNQFN